jgi:MarR family transcriptional regulator, organic hydroperoxide resistance regulator
MDRKEFFDLESFIFSGVDNIKFMLSPEQWSSMFLDYSKNDILTLLFVHRCKKANMTEIAEYINGPLNTVTGVVGRLEKKKMVERIRSEEDRRIINIVLTAEGKAFMEEEMSIIGGYIKEIFTALTEEEKAAAMSIFNKILKILNKKSSNPIEGSINPDKKIRKITIE